MAILIESKKTMCDSCPNRINKGLLMSVRKDNKWTLILCPKNIKKKLLSSCLDPNTIDEAFARFANSLISYPVCQHGVDVA